MKILLADDHPLFREGVKTHLGKLDDAVQIIEAVDYPSAFEAASGDLDLALLDLYMPGMHDGESVAKFRNAYPDVPVVILSASEAPADIQKLLASGAQGYITKCSSGEVILGALRLILAGGIYLPPNLLNRQATPPPPAIPYGLTERNLQVLRLLSQGKSNREIAEILKLAEGTIKVHMTHILRALKAKNRTEALLIAQKQGLIGPSPDEGHGA